MYKSIATIGFILIGSLHSSQGQNNQQINKEINTFVHEAVAIQTPVFEAIDNEISEDFIEIQSW